MNNTSKDVAQWMLEQLNSANWLYQETIVYQIRENFGKEFTYDNENGNLAIDRRVLREFRKLTDENVVWDRGERCWRFRQSYDTPDKRQVE